MNSIRELSTMQDRSYSNIEEKGSDRQTIIEDISKLILFLIPEDQHDLDSLETTLTPVFNNIRTHVTEQYFQSQDPDVHYCEHCGHKMALKENLPRVVIGLVPYNIRRHSFYCSNCEVYERPLDRILNLSGRFSLEIRKAMLLLGQRIPFQEASDYLDKLLHVQVSDQSIITLVESIGKAVHEEDLQMVRRSLDKEGFVKDEPMNQVKKEGIAYLQMDGMMVQTREESWKEIRNGILFLQDQNIKVDRHHNWIQEKSCFSIFNRHKNSLEMFKRRATAEAHRFGFEQYEKPVIIGDGAKWIWDYADEHHPGAIQILDYYHASEYLGNALKTIEVGKWKKEELFEFLSKGEIERILTFLSGQRQTEEIVGCIRYFNNHKHRMNYGLYKKQGLAVGSGAIESTHRTLIQSRMKQAGMHWKKKNVQSVASVRARVQSGRWDEMVDTHLKKAA